MGRPKRFNHPDPKVENDTIEEMKRQYCRERRKRQLQNGKRDGTCTKCGKQRVGNTELCELHYYQNSSWCRTGTTINAKRLKEKLEEQDFKCYYTGKPLAIGINASLDHVLSIKNHPNEKNDVENLVWCLKDINLMKNGMDKDEFIAICSLIAERFMVS
jgi:5-methylcytosine-specific restriction endonuclease McrA